ncbi:MAG: 3'-5' exonuclease [Polyangiaceae bacterium]|nr:3'-5' exonuclease [Polyangiaceae bacterium]
MRSGAEGRGCFPTGRHYPGIAHLLRVSVAGLSPEWTAEHPVSELPLVCIDTETTGRDANVDRVIEIACVRWENGEVSARHSWLVDPERPIPEDSRQVHGISDADVAGKPKLLEVWPEVLAALSGAVPMAYNADFDRAFLHAELARSGLVFEDLPPAMQRRVEWVDPLIWARELQAGEKSRALGDVCARLGIEIEQAHRAESDAEAAARVFAALTADVRVPKTYGGLVQEQRRLARIFAEERGRFWQGKL